jgi:hypothetical protein
MQTIQGVSEIGGQTFRAYSTCCKDEKKSYKHGSGNASFTSYMYGQANGNCRKAQRFYQEIFPLSSKNIFSSVHRQLRESGSFLSNTVNRGQNRNIRTPAIEKQVIRQVTENPRLSTRQIALEMQNVCSSAVWKILHEDLLYPHHIRVQAFLPANYPSLVIFAQWYLQECTFPNFEVSILFTDEVNFSHDAIINHHNNHLWSYKNLHGIIESRHQDKFSCNVCAGIIGDFLLGLIFLPPVLTGNNYTLFQETQLPLLLEDVPLQIRNQMWFMQEEAPAHFSRIPREFLIITPIDGLIEEDPLLGLHILPI